LSGDPKRSVSSDALGAIVCLTADLDNDPETPDVTQSRQLLGPAVHAGQQQAFVIHVGIGDATSATRVEYQWPTPDRETTVLEDMQPGRYSINITDEQLHEL